MQQKIAFPDVEDVDEQMDDIDEKIAQPANNKHNDDTSQLKINLPIKSEKSNSN